MKTLAIFGGSGATGKLLVNQALAAGYAVVALVRTPAKLGIEHQNLTVVQGDILDAAQVEAVVEGADVVLSALGPTENRPTFTISQGMQHILAAMQKHDVGRIIVATGAGVRDPKDKPTVVDRIFALLLRLLSKHVVADMERTVALVRNSDRAWTVVRVPRLLNSPAQGKLKVGYVGDIRPQIARADMATFMLQQVESDQFVRQAPAISN